jgi:hypothetical protein
MVMTSRNPDPIPCVECAGIAAEQLCTCAAALVGESRARCFTIANLKQLWHSWEQLIDYLLLATSITAFVVWLVLPQGLWEKWLCGYGMLGVSLLAGSLWKAQRELRTRFTVEETAERLQAENEKLLASTMQMSSDLDMLKDTIGAIGDKGDDWLSQLRAMYLAQKRENDRHSLLLRGHARIVLLQCALHQPCTCAIDHAGG